MPSTLTPDEVFVLWCELSRTPIGSVTAEERTRFAVHPLMPQLQQVPYGRLVDAGRSVVAGEPTLPLVLWLGAVERIDIVLDETIELPADEPEALSA